MADWILKNSFFGSMASSHTRNVMPDVMLSRTSRAGRFAMSKTARKEVRRAVGLAEELGLHSVTVRGAVWTLRHSKAQERNSSSEQRGRADVDAAGAAAPTATGDMEVPERETRPPNRKKRRSRVRMESHLRMHEERRARCEVARPPVEPAATSHVDDVAIHRSADEDETLSELAEEGGLRDVPERSQGGAAQPRVVGDDSGGALESFLGLPDAPAALASCLAACPSSGGHPSTISSTEPPASSADWRPRAARSLADACSAAATSTADEKLPPQTPSGKRRKKQAPLGLPRR